MNRSIWETLITALQAWEEIDFNATNDYERRLENQALHDAMRWLASVEPVAS